MIRKPFCIKSTNNVRLYDKAYVIGILNRVLQGLGVAFSAGYLYEPMSGQGMRCGYKSIMRFAIEGSKADVKLAQGAIRRAFDHDAHYDEFVTTKCDGWGLESTRPMALPE